jgi:hypothetical protein
VELIRFLNNGENYEVPNITHIESVLGCDYTLCGVTLDQDDKTAGDYKSVEADKITCPDCVALIKLCQGLKI